MNNKHYSSEFKQKVVDYAQKHTYIETQKEFKISLSSIMKWLKEYSIKKIPKNRHAQEIDEQIKILEAHGFRIIARNIAVPIALIREEEPISNQQQTPCQYHDQCPIHNGKCPLFKKDK